MAAKNDFSWAKVILLAAFCILGSFGGAFSIQSLIEHHSPAVLIGYGVAAGIFIAISAVIILQIVSFSFDA